jgi:hypothetical protein
MILPGLCRNHWCNGKINIGKKQLVFGLQVALAESLREESAVERKRPRRALHASVVISTIFTASVSTIGLS